MAYTAPGTISYSAGPATFEMFARANSPSILGGPEDIVNDARRTDGRTFGMMMRGQKTNRVLRHGPVLQDTIFLNEVQTTTTYRAGIDKVSYVDPQLGVEWTTHWRYFISTMMVRDQELAGAESMSQAARAMKYKDVLFMKKQNVYSGFVDFNEENYWRTPNVTTMEGVTSTAKDLMCIPAIVNEHTNGLFPSYTPGGVWATVQGVSPVTYPNWAPRQFLYGAGGAGFTVNSIANAIATLDEAMDTMAISLPPIGKEYFEPDSIETSPRPFLACGITGKKLLKNLYRASNDRWEDVADPWNNIMYNNMSIIAISALETATLYANTGATALVAEASADITGPRFYLIDPKYLFTAFCVDRFMKLIEVGRTPDDPEAKVYPWSTWGQNVATSRRRHAIISPSADN